MRLRFGEGNEREDEGRTARTFAKTTRSQLPFRLSTPLLFCSFPFYPFTPSEPRLHPEQERPRKAGAKASGSTRDGVDLVGEVADGGEKLESRRERIAGRGVKAVLILHVHTRHALQDAPDVVSS